MLFFGQLGGGGSSVSVDQLWTLPGYCLREKSAASVLYGALADPSWIHINNGDAFADTCQENHPVSTLKSHGAKKVKTKKSRRKKNLPMPRMIFFSLFSSRSLCERCSWWMKKIHSLHVVPRCMFFRAQFLPAVQRTRHFLPPVRIIIKWWRNNCRKFHIFDGHGCRSWDQLSPRNIFSGAVCFSQSFANPSIPHTQIKCLSVFFLLFLQNLDPGTEGTWLQSLYMPRKEITTWISDVIAGQVWSWGTELVPAVFKRYLAGVSDRFWSFLIVFCGFWSFLTVSDSFRPFLTVFGRFWPFLAVYFIDWLIDWYHLIVRLR